MRILYITLIIQNIIDSIIIYLSSNTPSTYTAFSAGQSIITHNVVIDKQLTNNSQKSHNLLKTPYGDYLRKLLKMLFSSYTYVIHVVIGEIL